MNLPPEWTKTIPVPTENPSASLIYSPTQSNTNTKLPLTTYDLSERDLDPEGPWLIIVSNNSVSALNSDGSGFTPLLEGRIFNNISFSYSANAFAFITDTIPDDDAVGLQLSIYNLPYGPELIVSELQNPQLIPASDNDYPLSPSFESMRAITMSSPKWSHDGKSIAFIGQQRGQSADLYVYDIEDGTIDQLTDGPSQAYYPSWSPDDRYIFHSGAWNFGTGAGFENAGSWVISRNGTRIIETTTGNGSDRILAWQNSSRFIIGSLSQPCGLAHIKSISIDTGKSIDIWPYYLQDFAYESASGQFVLLVPPDFESCSKGDQPTGLFLIDKIGVQPRNVSEQEFDNIRIDPSMDRGFILRSGNSLYRLMPSGDQKFLSETPNSDPVYSPASDLWMWYGAHKGAEGIWIGILPGIPRKVVEKLVTEAVWSPSGQTIFFIGSDDGLLYRADYPEFIALPISTTIIFDERSSLIITGLDQNN